MATEETVTRSPLEKPLQFLTEDDISQLTREDCRRYLKEKGMRRPSWNKSQAIQQVISLKRLLEATPDSGAGVRKKLQSIIRPQNPPSASKSTGGARPVIERVSEEPVPYRRKDLDKSDRCGDSVPLRNAAIENSLVGQLTIFYCGKVNVYDEVPAEKARRIMELAASPHQLSTEGLLDESTAKRIIGNNLDSANIRENQGSPTLVLSTTVAGEMNGSCRLHREENGTFREDNTTDGSCSRNASLQRYREKRKDRLKSKAKVSASSSASLDMLFANHNQTVEEFSNNTCSSPQIRPPNTPSRCSHFGGE